MAIKVCVVTGSRAEYGLLKNLMIYIRADLDLNLQLIVTGSHLESQAGNTEKEIIEDGFEIDERVQLKQTGDSNTAVANAMGVALTKLPPVLERLSPDVLVILGDRFEIFAAATAATVCGIPIAHIHGGELTLGAIDDVFRHAITKMAYLHFTSRSEYRNRIIQMGEDPSRVFNVGALAVDSIQNLRLLRKIELSKSIDFQFRDKNILVTYHPTTLDPENSLRDFDTLLTALREFKDMGIIFTLPNADPGNSLIRKNILEFCTENQNTKAFESLGHVRYLSCLREIDLLVGNSSSGLIEAAILGTVALNIGSRQEGRYKPVNVIDCSPSKEAIVNSIQTVISEDSDRQLNLSKVAYGQAGVSDRIASILKEVKFRRFMRKPFYDLPL